MLPKWFIERFESDLGQHMAQKSLVLFECPVNSFVRILKGRLIWTDTATRPPAVIPLVNARGKDVALHLDLLHPMAN
jgi:hypothetical protein